MSDQHQAKFVNGAIMRHITVMSTSGAVGLMALFLVDLADIFFISLLGQVELAAAVGFAGTIIFFLHVCFYWNIHCHGSLGQPGSGCRSPGGSA